MKDDKEQYIAETLEKEKDLIEKLRSLPEDIRRQIVAAIMSSKIADFEEA